MDIFRAHPNGTSSGLAGRADIVPQPAIGSAHRTPGIAQSLQGSPSRKLNGQRTATSTAQRHVMGSIPGQSAYVAKSGPQAMNFQSSNSEDGLSGVVDAKKGAPPAFTSSFNSSGQGGGAFRPISETCTVTPSSGTLSLSVPVTISQSRSGFEPKLALSYDSGAGNGPFGFGWGLNLPSIARKTANCIPTYDDDVDVFVLAGEEDLVPYIAPPGKPLPELPLPEAAEYVVRRYTPRVMSDHLRVEMWTRRSEPFDIHWRTITPDNVTCIFGRSNMSRLCEGPGSTHTYSWLICYSYDARGNAIEYLYKDEDSVGLAINGNLPCWEDNRTANIRNRQRYLKRVKYGNHEPNRDLVTWKVSEVPLKWMFEVMFDYGEHDLENPTTEEIADWTVRKDAFSSCASGFEIRSYRVCHRVLMFHHFPNELGTDDALISSLKLDYVEADGGTFLSGITHSGHSTRAGKLITQVMPPWQFEYSAAVPPENFELEELNTSDAFNLPSALSGRSQWLDLDGEGIPGILTTLPDGSLMYQKHRRGFAANDSAQPKVLSLQPSLGLVNKHYLEDLDGNGMLDLVCLGTQGQPYGFYERLQQDSWGPFTPFTFIPSTKFPDEAVQIDLTGDGHRDVIHHIDGDSIVWQQSLAKAGFSKQVRTPNRILGENSVERLQGTDASLVRQADMTGDGLVDHLEIRNGKVSYWQNLGHGRFGQEVVMHNAPILDTAEAFSTARIQLADVDGTGTTDLLYFVDSGGANLYFNYAGNRWSDPVFIPVLPKLDTATLVFALDLLGRGTALLCVCSPYGPNEDALTLRYIDLMGETKPHLLTAYTNGMGMRTTVKYEPSTTFFLDDERNGRPWTSRLPFPVQCVQEMKIEDVNSQSSKLSTYKYHNGYYDGLEREFRGFEFVEQWDYEVLHPSSAFSPKPLLTKTWFHLGNDRQSEDYSTPRTILNRIPDLDMPIDLREAYRALKGQPLRQEIYGSDGSTAESTPYSVTDSSYEVRMLQKATSSEGHGVFMTIPKEVVTSRYERNLADPQTTHDITLKVNDFGDVEQSVQIRYGRETIREASDAAHLKAQSETAITYSEVRYTVSIDTALDFRKPVPCITKSFRILGLTESDQLNADLFRCIDSTNIQSEEFSEPRSVLLSEQRVFYRSNDLRSQLDLGQLETYSVEDQTYTLALSSELVQSVLAENMDFDLETAGYMDLDDNTRWWAPSETYFFSPPGSSEQELWHARRSFYIPVVTKDPFGSKTTLTLDPYCLMPTSSTDALGMSTRVKNDYERLQPISILDTNLNRQKQALDCFGNAVGFAVMGKPTETIGDSLEGFKTILSRGTIENFLADPSETAAAALLGDARLRTIYALDRYHQNTTATPQCPTIIHISRNISSKKESPAKIHITIKHLNGYGIPLQLYELNEYGAVKPWRASECVLRDSSSNPVVSYLPFYTDHPYFRPVCEYPPISSLTLRDPMGREVAEIMPDYAWRKIKYESWQVTEWDRGDTVLASDPTEDVDIGLLFKDVSRSAFSRTWYERQTNGTTSDLKRANKSEIYADTPRSVHFDVMGYPFLTVEICGSTRYMERSEFDFAGNEVMRYDSLSRLVEKRKYDMLGNCLHITSMDAGEQWLIPDCMGRLSATWNSRKVKRRFVYDSLNRNTETRVRVGQEKEKLVEKITYGESPYVEEETGWEASHWNVCGRIWQTRDQSGVTTAHEYDLDGNCILKTLQFAKEYKSTIDWANNVVLSDRKYKEAMTFDYLHRQTTHSNASGNQTRTSYTRLAGVEQLDYRDSADSAWITYMRDAKFSADGLLLSARYGNDTARRNIYDDTSRLLLQEKVSKTTGLVLEDLRHEYDILFRKISTKNAASEDIFFQNCKVEPLITYTYDARGQLVAATGREQMDCSDRKSPTLQAYSPFSTSVNIGRSDGSQMCEYIETYEYDLAGNIKTIKHQPTSNAIVSGWTRHYHYEEPNLLKPGSMSNRLTRTTVGKTQESYAYDGEAGRIGCMTSLPCFSSIQWNYDNMLASSATQVVTTGVPETTYYVYNREGVRVRKVTERMASSELTPSCKIKETVYLRDLELDSRYTGDGITLRRERQVVAIVGDSKVALVESFSDLAKDVLVRYESSSNLELDDDANVVSYEEYAPFGACTYRAMGKLIQTHRRYRFARYLRDDETGFDLCSARYYLSWLGRWLSPDPLGTDPDLNMYRYCSNDPVNKIDPRGTEENCLTTTGKICLGIGKIASLSGWLCKTIGGCLLKANGESGEGSDAGDSDADNDEPDDVAGDKSSDAINPNERSMVADQNANNRHQPGKGTKVPGVQTRTRNVEPIQNSAQNNRSIRDQFERIGDNFNSLKLDLQAARRSRNAPEGLRNQIEGFNNSVNEHFRGLENESMMIFDKVEASHEINDKLVALASNLYTKKKDSASAHHALTSIQNVQADNRKARTEIRKLTQQRALIATANGRPHLALKLPTLSGR